MTVHKGNKPPETPASKTRDLLIEQSTQMALLQKMTVEHMTQLACLTLAQVLEAQRRMRQAMIRQVLPNHKTGPEGEG